jgi:hypothetical protein
MANEMTVTISISYAKGTDTWNKEVVSEQHDVGLAPRAGGTYSVTASAVNIPSGNISTNFGFGYFRNLDDTDSIDIGYDDSGFKNLLTLKAGMSQWVYFTAGRTPQAKRTSGAGASELEYMLFSV